MSRNRREAGSDLEPPVSIDTDSHLAYLIARVHHQLQRRLELALQAEGITPTQFFALAHVAEAPGLSSADLARGLLTTPQAVATLIRRLTAAGLITRREAARGLPGTIRLTAKGTRALRAAASVGVAAEAKALDVLTAGQQAQVAGTLRALLEGLENQPSE